MVGRTVGRTVGRVGSVGESQNRLGLSLAKKKFDNSSQQIKQTMSFKLFSEIYVTLVSTIE